MGPAWVSGAASFWYADTVKSSISVILFFLLSGFFLSALLGALERSRRLLGVAIACVVAVACVIVFLTPVELPVFNNKGKAPSDTTTSTISAVPTTGGGATSSTITTAMTGEGVSARSY